MRSGIRSALIWAPVLGAFLFALAGAQTKGSVGSLNGKVKERNGKSLEGVIIRATAANASEEKRETRSDSKGEFEFAELPPGQYTFSFDKQGYKTLTTRKQEITSGMVTRLSSVVEMSREGDPYAVIRGA